MYNVNGSRPDNVLLVRQYRLSSGNSQKANLKINLLCIDGFIGRYTIGYIAIGNNNDTFTFSMGESNDRIWKSMLCY